MGYFHYWNYWDVLGGFATKIADLANLVWREFLVKRNRFTVSPISDGAGETCRLWWREFLVKRNRLQSRQIGDGYGKSWRYWRKLTLVKRLPDGIARIWTIWKIWNSLPGLVVVVVGGGGSRWGVGSKRCKCNCGGFGYQISMLYVMFPGGGYKPGASSTNGPTGPILGRNA